MKVLLIGSGGYLGTEIQNYFKNKNITLILVTSKNNFKNKYNYKSILKIKKYKKIDLVLFLAGLDESNSINLKKSINAKKKILTLLLKLSKIIDIKRIIYFSSIKVYSELNIGKVRESNHNYSKSIYSKAHLFAENFILNKFKSNNPLILRLSNIYGSKVNSKNGNKYFLNSIIYSFKKYKKISIKSNFNFYRDYISIDYFLDFLNFLINKNTKIKKINLCSGKMTSVRELITKIKNISKFINDVKISSKITIEKNNNYYFCTSKLSKLSFRMYKNLQLKKYFDL